MTDLPFLSDLERLAKKATDGSGTTFDIDCSPFNILSLIAALRDVGIECATAKQKLSSIRSAMLSEGAVESASVQADIILRIGASKTMDGMAVYAMDRDELTAVCVADGFATPGDAEKGLREWRGRAAITAALDKAGIP